MSKLEELEKKKKKLLDSVKILNNEIFAINKDIAKLNKIQKANNEASIKANIIIGDYGRDNLMNVVLFLFNTVKLYGTNKLKMIDIELIKNDEELFNIMIVSMGQDFVNKIMKEFSGVETIDGELKIERNYRPINNKNLGKRLVNKLTSKAIMNYLKENYDR